jgi:ferric-dicitrate binding protein FerR (iron transport regulator)
MEDIYKALSKHFLNESSDVEEVKVTEFKKEKPIEYKLLAELWKKEKVEIIDFDTKKAWEIVASKVKGSKTKVIPIYRNLLRVASVAAVFVIGMFSFYYFSEGNISLMTEQIELKSNKEKKEIVLPDGSKVWLNKDAILTYPSKFSDATRNVTLEGEAFFEITKNKNKPFIVEIKNANVEVLGTSFNINSSNIKTEVIVATGKVKVSNKNATQSEIITLGNSVIVSNNDVKKHKTDNVNYLAWKTGDFKFKEAKISEAIEDLNTYYKTKIVIENNQVFECSLTANFENEKLENIIEVIKLTCNVNVIKESNKYILK